MRQFMLSAFCLTLFTASTAFPQVKQPDRPKGNYVYVEIKGTMMTGIAAIGGETTGVLIRSENVTWEVDLPKDLKAKADQFNKKTVLVKGYLSVKRGVEIRRRTILKASSVVVADK